MVYKSEKSLIVEVLSGFKKFKLSALFVVSAMVVGLSPAVLTAGDNGPCIECHTKPDKLKTEEKAKINPVTGEIKVVSMLIDEVTFKASAHGGDDFFCTDCHQDLDGADLTEGHKPNLKPVDCITFCHDDPADDYLQSNHVKLMKENNRDVPTCKDCHAGLTYHYTSLGEKSPRDVPRGVDPLHRKLTIDSCGAHLRHPLAVARLLALAPEPLPGARPVDRVAGRRRFRQRLTIGPRDHQHPPARGILRDHSDQAVGVEPDGVEPHS